MNPAAAARERAEGRPYIIHGIMPALDLSDRTVINYIKLVQIYERESERDSEMKDCSSNIHIESTQKTRLDLTP